MVGLILKFLYLDNGLPLVRMWSWFYYTNLSSLTILDGEGTAGCLPVCLIYLHVLLWLIYLVAMVCACVYCLVHILWILIDCLAIALVC